VTPPLVISSPKTLSVPTSQSSQISAPSFQITNYQGVIEGASIENELLAAGYAPISRIILDSSGIKRESQYIKAKNKKGQTTFIELDSDGYTTARTNDLTLLRSEKASEIPYSIKTGAMDCAGQDVCGVAFECGLDSVCILSKNKEDLTPVESNFIYVEKPGPSAAVIKQQDTIMSYPVVRLSEIRTNPDLVTSSINIVSRRLRNASYETLLRSLVSAQASIEHLNKAFADFNNVREQYATGLNETLTQLENMHDQYEANPPTTDEGREKYRRVQSNLSVRNDGLEDLLRGMTIVSEQTAVIESVADNIQRVTELLRPQSDRVRTVL
jgi:hypothetical protein